MPAETIIAPWSDIMTGQRNRTENLACEKCGCDWLQIMEVQQYPKMHTVSVCQRPVAKMEATFFLFKCPKCGNIIEPTLTSTNDSTRKVYDRFLDLLLGPSGANGESV